MSENKNIRELSMDEMGKVSGGARYGGTQKEPRSRDLKTDEDKYQIRPGDTLAHIARKFGTTTQWLIERNSTLEGPYYDLMAHYWIIVPKR